MKRKSNTPAITSNDQQLITLWLHERSEHTQRAYRSDVHRLLAFTGKSVGEMTLADIQAFANSLNLKQSSKARTLNSIKSLFSFAHMTGYTPFNVGAALRLPKLKDSLAQRIISEEMVIKMIDLETNQRNHALLRLLYHAGLRVSEVVSLTWGDLIPRNGEGQLTIFGKGGKTRQVLISASLYEELLSLEQDQQADAFIFPSHGVDSPFSARQVERIVAQAAQRAGIKERVSPHWLRHAHASHSLDHGAPVNLVRETLGHASIATTGKYAHARPNESSGKFLPR